MYERSDATPEGQRAAGVRLCESPRREMMRAMPRWSGRDVSDMNTLVVERRLTVHSESRTRMSCKYWLLRESPQAPHPRGAAACAR